MVYAKQVVSIAEGEVGYREKGTNNTKYADQVKALNWAQYQPWCSTFITWLFQKAEARDLAPVTASCAAGAAWFKSQRRFSDTPHVGDVVYYGPHGGTHVELVVGVSATHITTIGGNTSGNADDGQYFAGDGVYQKDVLRNSSRIYGYGHPDYDQEKKAPRILRKGMKGSDVKAWQKTLVKLGYDLEVDGDFGPVTKDATEDFQTKNGIEADGEVGPITRSKV
jgi:hypothetical protein